MHVTLEMSPNNWIFDVATPLEKPIGWMSAEASEHEERSLPTVKNDHRIGLEPSRASEREKVLHTNVILVLAGMNQIHS